MNPLIKNCVMCSIFTLFMCVASIFHLELSFTPIPVTPQLIACLAAGAVIGPGQGAASMLFYALLGALGLPVFSGFNSGIAYILGPTGGYIIGFAPCAFVTGRIIRVFYIDNGEYYMQFAGLFVAMTAGTVILYFIGALYYSCVSGASLGNSFVVAVLPFMWIDLFKIVSSAAASLLLLRTVFVIN